MVSFKLLKIDNWDEFEDLCCELWKKIWRDDNVQRYGRQGQLQNGVDIYHMSSDGLIDAIQCKKVDNLPFKTIDDEINKAKNFNPKLNSLTFATTSDKDAKLQSYVLEKSQNNVLNGLFEVNIKFWDDISQYLLKNTDVLKQFFPDCFFDNYVISSILDDTYNELNKFNYLVVENNLYLLKTFFENFSDENKYKYLILEGRFFLLCNNIEESSKNFLKAFDYSCKDIESKYYKSLGLFYKSELEECNDILNGILKEDTLYENAYDLLLLVNHKLSFSDLIELIPNDLNESKLINFRLGIIAFEKTEYDNAINYLLKADLENPIVSIILDLLKLQIFYNENKHLYLDYYDSFVDELKDIEYSLQTHLDDISDTILKYNIDWLINLTEINLYLNNNSILNINLERGLKIFPKNNRLLLNKSIFLNNIHKTEEAISVLEDLINVYPKSFDFLSKILYYQGMNDKIINHGVKLIENFNNVPEEIINTKIILINLYLSNNKREEALKLINSLKNIHEDFYYNLCMSEYCGDSKKSYEFLNFCKNSMDVCDRKYKLVLANKCKLLNDFNSAIEVYEEVLDLNYYSNELEILLECYFDNNDYKKIIDLCEKFISKEEYYPNLLKYLMNIYSMVNDYGNLKRISELYLNHFDDDSNIKFNLMRINLIEKNYSEIDSFISEKQDFSSLDLELAILFYHLCRIRGFSNEKLLNILFDILINNYDNIIAHEFYSIEILRNGMEFDKYERVNWDNCIFLKYPNKEEWRFLSKSSNKYPFDIINENDELSKVLGKTIGDEINVGYNKIEILDIRDKFHYCFKRSIDKIQDYGSKHIKSIYLDNPTDLKPIFNVIDNHSERVEILTQIYENDFIPIYLFSRYFGRDFIDSYYYLLGIGLKSFDENDLNNINKNDKLVVDISSLLTIHYLKIENKLTEHYEFVTSYSTLLILREIFEETKSHIGNEGESIYKQDGNYYRVENNYENKLEFVEKLIKWVEENCEFIPTYALLDLNSDLRKLIFAIDEPFITDNILIASNENFLFLCDDLYVKNIAKQFNVNSLGVLNLIKDSYSKEFISKNDYLNLTNILYMKNFKKFYLKSENIIYEIKNYNFLFLSKILLNINDFNVNIVTILVEVNFKLYEERYDDNLRLFIIEMIQNSFKHENNRHLYFLFLNKIYKKIKI